MDRLDLRDETPHPILTWRGRVVAALRRPIAVALFGVALIGLLALLYLNEVAGVQAANNQLAALRDQQARLERQESLLREQLGQVTNPAYIERRARALGLVSAPNGTPVIFIIRTPRGAIR
jgi:cell division protein FtsB